MRIYPRLESGIRLRRARALIDFKIESYFRIILDSQEGLF